MRDEVLMCFGSPVEDISVSCDTALSYLPHWTGWESGEMFLGVVGSAYMCVVYGMHVCGCVRVCSM